ncbi:MAG: aldo/keto reductase [Bacteroidales bacterium]|nr:aldo/keto reductase [Bacteroidales bacterium]
MDRRQFIKSAGLGAAALGVAACAPKKALEGVTVAVTYEGGEMKQNYPGVGLLGYGCMRWPEVTGEDGKRHIDQNQVNALIDKAMANGINYYDAAPTYLQGDCERATAEALNRYPRESWMLATKLSNFSDFSFKNSVAMYRHSLETFKTDYIDYYLLHSISTLEDFQRRFESTGMLDFLLKEREAGHVRNLGFSFHGDPASFDALMALHEKYHWDFVQIQMNYVDWTHAGGRNTDAEYLYAELDKREIPIVIMEPLRGGRLSNMPAALSDMLKAKEPSRSIASWAFRFAGSFPRVMCVLSGMTYMEHLDDNLATYKHFKEVSEEEKALLEEVADLMETYPLVRCTDCKYCMPCPYGIDIPGIFKFYNDNVNAGTFVQSKEQEGYARARRKYLLAYNEAIPTVRQADHCINCNKCARNCPQRIAIPRELRRIDQYIESLKQETL